MIRLKLLVPVAVHPDMYPWGVQCLRYAASVAHPDVAVDLIDLRYASDYVACWRTLRDVYLPEVSAGLDAFHRRKVGRPLKIGMQTERDFHQLSSFLELVRNPDAIPADAHELLDLVAECGVEVEEILGQMDGALRTLIGPPEPSMVVGVSVYQFLLLHSLGLARQVRGLYPDATLLLGGDPFDIPTATKVVRANPWLDGCVVGPGEYALNDVLSSIKAGARVREAPITRVVNDAFLEHVEASTADWNRVLETRSDYDAVKGYHGVEWNPATRAIHVLGRRGCAWAVCTFCQRMHVITKEFVFDPSTTLMQREIRRLLDEHFAGRLEQPDERQVASRNLYDMPDHIIRVTTSSEDDPLLVRFDADDADVPAIVDLIAWLDDQVPEGQKLRFYSYAPARQLAKPELHSLATAFHRDRIDVRFGVPIETLNPKTTETMKKGGNVLGAIKAMKVAADAGVDYVGLYFAFYPLEGLEDVAEECYFLERSLHLLAGRYQPTIYAGSYRDPIGQDPGKYGLRLHDPLDPIMQLLGMELGPTYNCEYELVGKDRLADVQNDYLELLRVGAIHRSTIDSLLEHAPRWLFRQASVGDFAYLRRLFLVNVLSRMRQPSWARRAPKLYLEGDRLVRVRPWWLGAGFRRRLSKGELELLRSVYHPRKSSEVIEELAHVDGVEAMIRSFEKLGVIVRYGNMVMSVANDPVRLRELAGEVDLDRLREKAEKLDSEEGVVRVHRGERKDQKRRLTVV